MAHIFAIGGGEIARRETLEIDRRIVAAAETAEPTAVFVPTASGDATGYVETFEDYYGDELGCHVETLLSTADSDAIRDRLERADLVYVGGGDAGHMIDTWAERGIDDELVTAALEGTVCAGLSAGALCWFEWGLSDAVEDGYGTVPGLAVVSGLAMTPHATAGRRDAFADAVARTGVAGVALEDRVALEVRDDQWRLHGPETDRTGYHYAPGTDSTTLPTDGAFRPLTELVAPGE